MSRGPLLSCMLAAIVAASCAQPPLASAPPRPPAPRASASSPAPDAAPSGPTEPRITAPDVQLPAVNHTALPNGLAIWHVPSRTVPAVHLRLVVRAGRSLDRDRPGLAQLLATALSTPEPGAAPPLAPPAARVSNSVISLDYDVPRSDMDAAVDMLGAIARQPRLDNPPLALLRNAVRARNETVIADPVLLADAIVAHELFGLTPIPTSAELAKITAADLKALHKAAFAPSSAGLVAVGDVTFDEVVQAARRAFGAWDAPTQAMASSSPPASVPYTRVFVTQRPGLAQTTLMVASAGPQASDPAWPQLWIARAMIAGSLPSGSSCRKPGPGDVLSLEAGASPVAFTACERASDAQAPEAAGAALEAFKHLSTTPAGPAQLESARAWFLHSLANQLSGAAKVADLLGGALGAGTEHDAAARQLGQTRAVQAAQVRDALRVLTRQGLVLVAVTSDGTMPERLASYGDVVVLDAEDGFARKRQVPATPQQAPAR